MAGESKVDELGKLGGVAGCMNNSITIFMLLWRREAERRK
jgi:hypothetical protein